MSAEAPSILDTEWDLMEVLWARERATAREVADAVQDQRGWAYSTVKTMLDRMVDKGLIDARRVGNVWEYTPSVAQTEARRGAWQRFIGTAFGGATAPALRFLATGVKLTRKQREQLIRMLGEEDDDA